MRFWASTWAQDDAQKFHFLPGELRKRPSGGLRGGFLRAVNMDLNKDRSEDRVSMASGDPLGWPEGNKVL